MSKLTATFLSVTLGSILYALPVAAQQDKGTISGLVTDPSGAIIPQAKVTLRNVGTGYTRSTPTGAAGEYVFTPLEVGIYQVTAEASGFKTEVRRNLELQVQQKLDVNFTLQVGSPTQTVEVKATAPPLQTSDSSLGQVVDTQKILNLPLNGRNIYQLAYLVPGAAKAPDGRLSLTGQPSQQQSYLLDGIDNNNYQGTFQSGPAYNLSPSPDAVQEFKVQTNNYSSEFGRAGGGIVNVVTRSGTNEFHGSLYEFHRNARLDARNFFAPSKPRFTQNQFGASLGGPLSIPHVYDGHNRSFFFIDYEGFRSRKGRTKVDTLPSMAWRAGDFRDLLTGQTFTDPCTGARYDIGQIFDPTTTRAVSCLNGSTGFVRDPIPSNLVDPSKIVAPAKNALALLPVPSGADPFEFRWSPVLRNDSNQFDVKIDHQWGIHDHLSWRYAFRDVPRIGEADFPGPAGRGDVFRSRQQGIAFGDTHIFSPHTVNEFRYGYTRNTARDDLAETQLDPRALGFEGVPYERGTLGGLPGIDFAEVGGMGNGGWTPSLTTARDHTFVETLSLVRGKHSFKTGASLDSFWFTQFLSPAPSGEYAFNGPLTADVNASSTGNGVAQFLFGVPDFSNISGSILSDNGRQAWAVFFQDDWKVTPKLTVNAGLRWEFGNTLHERFNRITTVDYKTGAFVIPATRKGKDPMLGPSFPVEYSNNESLLLADNNNVAPRIGLAYQLRQRTVIRSAFGVFYHYPYTAGTLAFPLNPPWGPDIFLSAPATGPIDPVTGKTVVPVTSITTGFPPLQALQDFADRSLMFLFDTKFLYPYTLNWNFAIQQDVGANTVVEIAYSGTKGNKILTGADDNQPFPTADPNSPVQARRPIPNQGAFGVVHTMGKSTYHALQVKAEKRYSQGLTFLGGYTWAHSIDMAPLSVLLANTGSSGDSFRNARNFQADRGNSSYDVRHRFVLSWMYDLPWGRGRTFGGDWPGVVDQILGGWHIGGITQLQSGFHFTPVTSFDPAYAPAYVDPARAQLLGDPKDFSGCPGGRQSLNCFFNPAAFGHANPGEFGNAGRNILEGPGFVGVDFTIHKDFRIGERRHLEFRTEVFNILNTPNFANPGNRVESRRFAAIRRTIADPRDIQFALKFVF